MDLSSHEGEIPAIPITSPYLNVHDHHPSNNNTEDHKKSSLAKLVKYRECLKNHAASIGGNATDGCGEFMPSGEDGTLEAFKCSACNCHRNFHRKEVEGDHHHHHQHQPPSSCHEFYLKGRKGVLISGPSDAFGYNISRPVPPPQLIMPLGAIQTSESDEMEMGRSSNLPMVKKRFRTKFTQEQKEKMVGFAEKVGWRLQRQEEGLVQQFCQEIGVKRRVLKVWMHNNKHNLAKKSSSSSTLQLQ